MSGMKKVFAPEYHLSDKIKTNVYAIGTSMEESVYPHTATVLYPREKKKMPDNFRGYILFDPDKCISCFNCSFVCPANAIRMKEAPNNRYYPTIDYGKCIFCHFCIDSCSGGALRTTKIHDVAYKDVDEMFASTEEMIEPPEIIREDKKSVEYVIDEKDLHLKRKKERDGLFVEAIPPVEIPMVSQCVDRGSCLACKICEHVCESGAASSVVDEATMTVKMAIDAEKCTGCGLCVKECSMQILRLVRVRK
ncbi:MAG: 4Fe-4S binding protein [Euryarchaeota archaeon]|nr:4Fe-4S binding protein [Euryarchaeota archaeon]